MDIAERTVGGVAILDLNGRLILSDGEKAFRDRVDALLARGQKTILVNLDDVTYLDSAGIGAIVWKYVTLRRQGGSLKLLHLHARTHKVLSVTKLLSVLETFDSESDALASFQQNKLRSSTQSV
jgi:anti-sigma B factor antagonist